MKATLKNGYRVERKRVGSMLEWAVCEPHRDPSRQGKWERRSFGMAPVNDAERMIAKLTAKPINETSAGRAVA